jgi:hypothetical protein
LPCAIDTSIWRSSVTICSALNLFFGMTGSFPSSFSHNAWFKKARSGHRRFDVMKRWREADHMAFESFVSPDGLHMNDWSYACFAKGLDVAIAEAAQQPVMSAKAMAHLVP